MKRNILVVLILTFALILSACGSTPAEVSDSETFRVAVIMPSSTTDLAFSQSMYDALLAVQEEMGGEEAMEIVYSEGMFVVDDAAAAIRDYASEGFD